ncbi:mucin-2-like [Eriocheir sinensis]|uniref:mucin-2-like n=1 Tax=Eriocheir sinensis TaxID=95602 RepID=UPI0021C82A54|nr:mucin-2-like [Eriocheir sinensis]
MNTRLSLLMVFLKSLLPAPGASLSPGLDPRCPAHTTISGDDEWANIGTLKKVTVGWGMVLFVHPDPGFKGVRLVAAGDGWQQDAWFTLDNTCFPLDARWWRLWGGVGRRRNDDNNNDGILDFGVRTGDCYLGCRRTGHFLNAVNVTVVAHGPSRWRLSYPRQCTVEGYKQYRYSWINCTSPTTTTTTPTTTTTTTTTTPTTTTTTTTTTTPTTTTTTATTIAIIVVPVTIGVAVVVVLLVVLTKCYWQRRVNPVPRVPTRRGLAASWRVGGEEAVSDSHVEPPTGPTVLPRVAPRQQEHIFDDDEEHIYDEFPDPLICQQIPEPPIYEEIPGPPIYENVSEPPIYENISEHPPSDKAENLDSDDDAYLTPRRGPPGTPSGHRPSHEAENLDSDDDAYLTPRRAPMGTPSGITEG